MSEKMSKNMAMKYTMTSIMYLDSQPINFILMFHRIGEKDTPVVRVVVKYKKINEAWTVIAEVTVLNKADFEVTPEAESLFRGTALEAVSTLCGFDLERSHKWNERCRGC